MAATTRTLSDDEAEELAKKVVGWLYRLTWMDDRAERRRPRTRATSTTAQGCPVAVVPSSWTKKPGWTEGSR
jgi:hypothetical protein